MRVLTIFKKGHLPPTVPMGARGDTGRSSQTANGGLRTLVMWVREQDFLCKCPRVKTGVKYLVLGECTFFFKIKFLKIDTQK